MEKTMSAFIKKKNEREYKALKEAVAKLNEMKDGDDAEIAHGLAEDILCEYLVEIGAKELSDAFNGACERVGFWYG